MKLDSREIKKILIIKLAAIGDVMFASPLVQNLRENYPNAQIHWLADPWSELILKHIPEVSKTYFIERPWISKSKIKAAFNIPLVVKKLRKEKYDLAIIPHRSNLAFKLANMALIPIKVGFVEKVPNNTLDVSVEYDETKHEIERNLDLLRAIGMKIFTNEMSFSLESSFVEETIRKFLKDANSYIVISPGGGNNPGLEMSLKRWPKEHYLDLIGKFIKEDREVVLIGNDSDSKTCSFIGKNSNARNLCSQTSLVESAAIIKRANLFIGNDSGLLYIASALKVPTVGIYGPTDPTLLAPMRDNSEVASIFLDCAPCYHPQATIQGEYNKCEHDQKCLKDLSVDAVFEKANKIIK